MAGLQTGGFRPSQSINVRPVDPTQFVVDPNLMIRGLQEGFKFGSDIMTELDDLSLRPDVHAAKQAELKAKKAQAEGAAKTAPVAADSFVADAAAKDQLRDPATKNSLAQYGLGIAEATAQTGLVPQKTQVAKGELDAKAADQALASQLRPLTTATAVNTAATGALDSANAAAVASGAVDPLAVTPIDGANAVAVTDKRTGKVVLADKPKPANVKTEEVTLWNQAKGVPERIMIYRDPASGHEIKREVLGLAPEAGTNRMQSVQAKLNNLNASAQMSTDLNVAIGEYIKSGNGGVFEGFLERASRMDPGLNPVKWGVKNLAGKNVSPATIDLAGLIGNAVNTLRNSLFGSALSKFELEASKGQFPSADDLSNPALLQQKAQNLERFVKTQVASYDPNSDGFVAPPPRGPVDVHAQGAPDLGSVVVQPKGAPAPAKVSPTPVPASQVPAGARIARDAQGNRAFLQNGVWIPIQE